MVWTQVDATALVAWAVFIFWEPYTMTEEEKKRYERRRTNLVPRIFPSWIFPIVWTILKSLLLASIVLFSHYTIDTNHWAWLTVFGLFFVNQAISKMWTMLFFGMQRTVMALVVAIVLFLTALAILICMGIGNENCEFYVAPLVLFIPYALWLLVAIALNISWIVDENNNKSAAATAGEEVIIKAQAGDFNPLLGVSLVGKKIHHKHK